ncbi:hypothetical protein OH77DRAFT_1424285 [Trametes cingulata]|nr:hypothetical protein OH77DRAFT_1424285 [Trametes cingulata]
MRCVVFTVILFVYACAVYAAPALPDRRDTYTGRLFAHHAHERVGPTPTMAVSFTEAPAPATVTTAASALATDAAMLRAIA